MRSNTLTRVSNNPGAVQERLLSFGGWMCISHNPTPPLGGRSVNFQLSLAYPHLLWSL